MISTFRIPLSIAWWRCWGRVGEGAPEDTGVGSVEGIGDVTLGGGATGGVLAPPAPHYLRLGGGGGGGGGGGAPEDAGAGAAGGAIGDGALGGGARDTVWPRFWLG